MKEIWGCDKPTHLAVWVDGDDEFHSCPLQYLSGEAVEWYGEYVYNTDHAGAAPSYQDQSNRYIEAMKHYRAKLAEFDTQRQELEKSRR